MMNKKEFEKLEKSLYDRGYRKYNQHWHHEDYVIGKGFHKADNQWEEDRAAYQIIISVYDYSNKPEYWDRMSEKERNRVGLEVHVDISRTIDERLELAFAWHDNDSIQEVEHWAEKFYLFICRLFVEPREE